MMRDLEDLGMVAYQHVGTKLNKADLMTKTFGKWEFKRLSQLCGVFRTDVSSDRTTEDRARGLDAEGYLSCEREEDIRGARAEKNENKFKDLKASTGASGARPGECDDAEGGIRASETGVRMGPSE